MRLLSTQWNQITSRLTLHLLLPYGTRTHNLEVEDFRYGFSKLCGLASRWLRSYHEATKNQVILIGIQFCDLKSYRGKFIIRSIISTWTALLRFYNFETKSARGPIYIYAKWTSSTEQKSKEKPMLFIQNWPVSKNPLT